MSYRFSEFGLEAIDQKPLVSFITVTYKMPHFVRHLLRGLADAMPVFPFEFFLVDNGSEDETVNWVRERFPWVQVIASSRNLGLSAANNLALKQAQGEYIMHLNPDLTIFPGELEKWIAWMQTHPEIGISGPRLLNPDGTDQDSCYRFPRLWIPIYRRTIFGRTPWGKRAVHHYLMKDMDREKEQDVDWVLGAAMCMRHELVKKIGGFDERFFLYFEDTDLCRQAWKNGSRVSYTPAAKFSHYHRRESGTKHVWEVFKNPVTRIHIRSAVKYFLKYRGEDNPRRVNLLIK
ncbi:MAG TPA: glycosyltransferase family 2 protein [Patescibacteria group bacterium]|nr:glycosyltransferase family 2 protein [Patescibacteria group bacterium]